MSCTLAKVYEPGHAVELVGMCESSVFTCCLKIIITVAAGEEEPVNYF